MPYANPEAYQRFMGRWSARLARLFVDFVGLDDGVRVLDVGSGTGSLSLAVAGRLPNARVVGIDPTRVFVAYAREQISYSRLSFELGDAQALPFADESFGAALALLVLQAVPDPSLAIAEMRRVTRPCGRVAGTVWDFHGGMTMLARFWEAAREVDPAGTSERKPPTFRDRDAFAELWREAGFEQVEATDLAIELEFGSFDDFWLPFLQVSTPTSAYASNLDAKVQGALAERLRERLLEGSGDGPFSLPATAWAVMGRVPEAQPDQIWNDQ